MSESLTFQKGSSIVGSSGCGHTDVSEAQLMINGGLDFERWYHKHYGIRLRSDIQNDSAPFVETRSRLEQVPDHGSMDLKNYVGCSSSPSVVGRLMCML
jgi:hypothetical protein